MNRSDFNTIIELPLEFVGRASHSSKYIMTTDGISMRSMERTTRYSRRKSSRQWNTITDGMKSKALER